MRTPGELVVVHADNHLLAVAKPAGLACVPDQSADESLFDRAKEWIRADKEKPGEVFLGIVHRLDRPVSGVVLFARTSKAASRVSEMLRGGRVQKTYWALGRGRPPADEGMLEQWLDKDRERNVVRVVPPGTGKRALTRWSVRARFGDVVWFEFVPVTGRSHQLRHAALALGAPLLGDLKYGAPEPLPDKSIALHARALELEHPVRREPLRLEADLPRLAVWDDLR